MKIPSIINKNFKGQYCLNCYSTKVSRIFKNNRIYYFCDECKTIKDRSLVIDNAINWWIDNENNYWHESAGVIILNEKNELLVVMRAIYPFAYSLPAGHVDKKETPMHAAQREVAEEIGINLSKTELILIQDFQLPDDSCSRGCDHHLWHLYLARIKSSDQTIKLNDEASSFQWLSLDKIKSEKKVTYPLIYIVTNFRNQIMGTK